MLYTRIPTLSDVMDYGGRVHTLDELIGLDSRAVHVVADTATSPATLDDGRDDAPYPPELTLDVDETGQATTLADDDLKAQAKRAGWELVTGATGQYAYNGPVMHASEYIGGRLADRILDGTYAGHRAWWTAVVVTVADDDGSDLAGWALAYRTDTTDQEV